MSEDRNRTQPNSPPQECQVIPLRHGLDAFIAERRTDRKQQLASHHALQAGKGEPVQLSLDVDIPPERLPIARQEEG